MQATQVFAILRPFTQSYFRWETFPGRQIHHCLTWQPGFTLRGSAVQHIVRSAGRNKQTGAPL
jgi:hypothetical protein